MSGQLNALGVIKHFADAVGGRLVEANLGWPAVFGLLNAVYFGLHYMFASQTAHVGALYAAFLAMMLAAGVPCLQLSPKNCQPKLFNPSLLYAAFLGMVDDRGFALSAARTLHAKPKPSPHCFCRCNERPQACLLIKILQC